MQYLGMNECRSKYLDFFEAREHTRLVSFSLIPEGDDSLLLINAGMAPLKPYFMGEKKMPHNRATSSQRCVRTADIDNVGKTARHATFFEMLGNFSFGNYFKPEAISWAWTFLTEEIGLESDRLWITVFEEDQQAYDIWTKTIGVAPDHVLRLGKEDNFWELEQGPCGPCSEIHYDRGPSYGEGTSPLDNDDRFMEIWNLVFTQFDRQADGSYVPLDHPNIDTGMGLERLALVCENKDNIFELDEFQGLRSVIHDLSGKQYGEDPKADESFRVIIDHSKAITFLVSDGVVPSNEGRGYVLRRLLRRAARYGKLLGIQGKFLRKTITEIMKVYGAEYPEILEGKERIFTIVEREEENFQQTIDQGLELLEGIIAESKEKGKNVLDGERVFRLYDTFGFPIDLTREIAAEQGQQVDEADFRKRMEEQRLQSRQRRKETSGWDTEETIHAEDLPSTAFTGYVTLEDESVILALYRGTERVKSLSEGEKGIAILDRTPFYAEGGGQVADKGTLKTDEAEADVEQVKKDRNEIFMHSITVRKGTLHADDCVQACVEKDRREDIRRNHSATHLLNKALHLVLGNHINQAGSLVDPERLRFDFTHYEAMSAEELQKVEKIVNRAIFESYPVETRVLPLQEAMDEGAIGLFEDKYHDEVRVVSMGDFSKELCGGTHVDNTAQLQAFHILSEQGVSSGVRRIEAVTGRAALARYKEEEADRQALADLLKVPAENLLQRIQTLLDENKAMKHEIETFQSKMASELSQQLNGNVQKIAGVSVLGQRVDGKSMNELKDLADALKEQYDSYVIALAAATDGKVYWVVSVAEDLVKKGLKAGDLVKSLAQITGGNGGGRPQFATAGGKTPAKIDEALQSLSGWVEDKLS